MSDEGEEPSPEQIPRAVVLGAPFTRIPEDLYIPPDALEVFLETFEGPLDLLLYLIKRQNLNILDIPIASITRQYIQYIEMMNEMRLELAAEYLVMAAMLAEIKSRLLLPKPVAGGEEEDDPRAELVRRLQEYERFKKAAEDLDTLPRQERDIFAVSVDVGRTLKEKPQPDVDLKDVLIAFQAVLRRAERRGHHHIQREWLSVRERMSAILDQVKGRELLPFTALFKRREGRHGAVVSLLAVLELGKEGLIDVLQNRALGELWIKACGDPNAGG